MTIYVYNTSINRGATFSRSIKYLQNSNPVDLTGATITAQMKINPETCSGRKRTPVDLTIQITSPASGIFVLYLSPSQTASLILGDYSYSVLYTPASSSDKFEILSGTITVTD